MSQSHNTINRLICIKAVPYHLKSTFLGDQILSVRQRRHTTRLVKEGGVCFYSILNDVMSAEKNPDGPSKNNDFKCANMAVVSIGT